MTGKVIIWALVFGLWCFTAPAATYYCGPSSTGSGSGADFNNRLALPVSGGGARGNTYVYIEGSYGGVSFTVANSGSTPVTWRQASTTDSAVAGYSAALHDGIASFGEVNPARQYFIWQAKPRVESLGWSSPVGRYYTTALGISANSLNSDDSDNASISDVCFGPAYNENPGAGTIAGYGQTIYLVYNQQNVTFTRCHFFGWTRALYVNGSSGFTFDHCDIGPGWGKEAIGMVDANVDNLTIKYCRFYEASQLDPGDGSSGITAEIGGFGYGTSYNNVKVYGCWFYNSHSAGRNSCIGLGGLGKTGTAQNCLVYNNTFVLAEASSYSHIQLVGSGNQAFNNLAYNTAGGMSVTVSGGTAGNNIASASDPFVGVASRNYRIISTTGGTYPRNAGSSSPGSSYNQDPDGITRGSDGTWDVGAFEYASSSTFPPVITSSLTAVATNGIAFSPAYSITTSNSATSFGATPLPLGLSHSAGTISGTPTGVVSYSTNVTITATNSAGQDSEVLVITVYNGLVPSFSTSPVARTNSEATGVVLTSAATTTYGAVSYQWQSNSINISGATSANYSKVPAVVLPDSGFYRVIASNSWGSVTSSAVYVSITNASAPPVITPANLSGTINQAITSFQINATEGPTAYGAANLQAGLSVNGSTGLITGTPTVASTNSVVLSATNAFGFDQETVTFSISAGNVSTNITVGSRVAVNISPTLRVRDAAALAGNILGEQSYLAEGVVTGGPTTADGYTWWNINYDAAPDGWSIEGASGVYWLVVAPPGGDTTAPSITQSTPTSGIFTKVAGIVVAGTASDNVALADVKYRWTFPDGTHTDIITATGTTSWSFPVTLQSGSNYFNIWATDTSSNTNATSFGIRFHPASGIITNIIIGTLNL